MFVRLLRPRPTTGNIYTSLFKVSALTLMLKHMLAKQNLTAFKFPKTAMPTYSHRQRKAYTSVSNPIDRRAYLINKSARHVDFQERKQPKTQRLLVGTRLQRIDGLLGQQSRRRFIHVSE